MLKRIDEKEILNIATLIKTWEETHKVTVDDYAVLNLADISIMVDEEWDKVFSKDVPDTFKTDMCDYACCEYFDTKDIPTYAKYMKLVDDYNKAKDDDREYYYYYLIATMMKSISYICEY